MTRVYLHTFGCKANQYDSEVVRQALQAAGVAVADHPEGVDAAVVNSCTVTHTSEGKMRALVRRLARRNPNVRTVIMGCAAARSPDALRSLPGVVGVVAGADASQVLAALGIEPGAVSNVLRRFARGARAWLRIQDGCDEHCTFCATRLARGPNRSRPAEQLVDEAQRLADSHAEIVLTGVHIGAYGTDLAPGSDLGRLCERLICAVPAVRFRLSSIEATEVDRRLEELLVAAPERLAPHLHAPLQSGSDRILKRMGRHWYTAGSYRRRIEALAERLPVLGLGADVIVGFPGETEEDFALTERLVAALPYTYLHVFPYSERPGTAAQRLGGRPDPRLVAERSERLRQLAAAKQTAYFRRRLGTQADAVRVGPRAGAVEALTGDYLTVAVRGAHVLPPRCRVRVDRLEGNRLWAVLDDTNERP